MAVLIPVLVGVKVTTNPVVPVVIAVEGKVVTLNAPALGPVKKIVPSVSVPAPELLMEKVREAFVPKSVLLLVLVIAPIGTLFPFPFNESEGCTVMVTMAMLVLVHPAVLVPATL